MLERSYRDCLLAADLIEPGVLAKGALAESIAPLVRIPGPRLRWTTTPLPNPAARRGGASPGTTTGVEGCDGNFQHLRGANGGCHTDR
jgi:hypothetical protein